MMQTSTQAPAWGKVLVISFLLTTLLSASLMLASRPAHAGTSFTVTSISDTGDGVCDRTCTLREAIIAANNAPGQDVIDFGLTGITGAAYSIFPTSELPLITEAVTIDGYSQEDAFPNTQSRLDNGTNARLMVQLNGSNAGPGADGLDIRADNVEVRGLAIGSFGGQGIRIDENGARVKGNFIGVKASGSDELLDFGNGGSGVRVFGSEAVSVGGASPEARNIISDNGQAGVNLQATGTGTRVQGNLIGTESDGASPLGNDQAGVVVANAGRNLIGGTRPGEANTIAFNAAEGVTVQASAGNLDATGNRISSNSIFANGGLGIDLRGGTENAAGVTANDPRDPDTGANDLQNKPVVTSAVTSGGKTIVQAKLNSTPTDPFVVEFFSNPAGNEGKKPIGNKAVSTNANGNATFTFTPSQTVPAEQIVTATATNAVEANTSEFSLSRTVVAG